MISQIPQQQAYPPNQNYLYSQPVIVKQEIANPMQNGEIVNNQNIPIKKESSKKESAVLKECSCPDCNNRVKTQLKKDKIFVLFFCVYC